MILAEDYVGCVMLFLRACALSIDSNYVLCILFLTPCPAMP